MTTQIEILKNIFCFKSSYLNKYPNNSPPITNKKN